jgi:peptidoglycan/xylan/chitin deacetylase (PgdA/CDA1 family)
MKEKLKDTLKRGLYHFGYYSLYEYLRAPAENRLLILMYHSVVTDEDQRAHWFRSDTPSRSQFRAVLATLKKHYRLTTVEDAVEEIRAKGKLAERSAAITFDDGYASTYTVAFPLLKEYGASATVYVPTDWIDARRTPWWLALIEMIEQADLTPKMLEQIERLAGRSFGLRIDSTSMTANGKSVLHARLAAELMRRDDTSRGQMMHELREWLVTGRKTLVRLEEPMTWEQIKEMAAQGIRFGAHTCSHPNLSFVDLETAEYEIRESKRIIESHLGTQVAGFAYPYGYDVAGYRRFRPILEKLNLRYACTSWCGQVDPGCDMYLLGRIGMPLSSSRAIIARTLSLEYCAGDKKRAAEPIWS